MIQRPATLRDAAFSSHPASIGELLPLLAARLWHPNPTKFVQKPVESGDDPGEHPNEVCAQQGR